MFAAGDGSLAGQTALTPLTDDTERGGNPLRDVARELSPECVQNPPR